MKTAPRARSAISKAMARRERSIGQAKHRTPNTEHRTPNAPDLLAYSTLGIRCWGLDVFFISFPLLQPCFPAAFEHEHVFQLRFLAQAARNFPAGVATLAAAIDDNLLLWGPRLEQARQQFIPAIFIQ